MTQSCQRALLLFAFNLKTPIGDHPILRDRVVLRPPFDLDRVANAAHHVCGRHIAVGKLVVFKRRDRLGP